MIDGISGKGNSLHTYYRKNDTQTGEWLTIDPKADLFPSVSPYVLYGGNPIVMVDPLGDIVRVYSNSLNEDGTKYLLFTYKNRLLELDANGQRTVLHELGHSMGATEFEVLAIEYASGYRTKQSIKSNILTPNSIINKEYRFKEMYKHTKINSYFNHNTGLLKEGKEDVFFNDLNKLGNRWIRFKQEEYFRLPPNGRPITK